MVNQTVRQRRQRQRQQQQQQQTNSFCIQTTSTNRHNTNQHQQHHQQQKTCVDKHNIDTTGTYEYDDDDDDDDEYNNNDKNGNNNIIFQWIESIAIFGDSVYSLLAVTIVLLLSIFISYNHVTIYHYYNYYYGDGVLVLENYGNNNQMEFNIHSNIKSTIQLYDNNKKNKINTDGERFLVNDIDDNDTNNLYNKKLGPIPKIDPPYIFTVTLDENGNIQYNNDNSNDNNNDNNNNDNNNNDNDTTIFHKIHTAFYKDGVVAIRGLLSNDLLQQLDDESMTIIQDLLVQKQSQTKSQSQSQSQTKRNKKQNQFFTVKHRILFHNNNKKKNNNQQSLSAFAKVALRSAIPTLVAALHYNLTIQEQQQQQQQQQMMMMRQKNDTTISANIKEQSKMNNDTNNNSDNRNIRVVRDIFLAKDNGQHVCGWHVDDMGFWPITQTSSTGINVWIAIDDIPIDNGGGFALAVQSHLASWNTDAHIATGSSLYFPLPYGYTNASHMILNRTGAGTCNIQQVAPHLHQRMEDTSRVYNIRRGDIIIHTRWLFHRTIPFINTTDSNDNNDINSRIYRRYSIRYGPGSTSIISPGYGTEYSVLWNESYGGQSADDICTSIDTNNTPWYPIAWRWNNNSPIKAVENTNENIINKNNTTEQVVVSETQTATSTTSLSKNRLQEEQEEDIILANQFDDMVQTKFPIVEKIAQQRQIEIQRLLIQHQQQQNTPD